MSMTLTAKKPTIREIAQLARVSTATVSRALTSPEKVSPSTRQLVLNAVTHTGYVANEAARNLRKQQTDTIVVLTPNIGNSFFSNIVEGIEEVCAKNQFSVLLVDTQKASMNSPHARSYFSRNRVDGMVILDGQISTALLNVSRGHPAIVFAGEWNPTLNIPFVAIDDELGSRLAVQYLYELGHRHIGHIAGPLDHIPGQRRYRSFMQTRTYLKIDHHPTWLFEGLFCLQTGQKAAHAWAALPTQDRPSALFCAGDEIAFGFMSTLHKLGFRVPDDVSIVGYDDLDVAQFYMPALTTIHQPRRALGRLAAEQLLALIRGHTFRAPPLLKPTLVIRDSARAALSHLNVTQASPP